MDSKRWIVVVVWAALFCVTAGQAGCGSVYLRGEAAIACETSAMDAYQAVQRAQASATQPAASQPAWMQPYLQENYKQWRNFVRANRKDASWGPKLPGETSQ